MSYIKTAFLLALLSVFLILIGGAFGGRQGMTIALVFAFIMNFFAYWFSDKIVLRMYGAKEVSEAEAPELFGLVRRLSMKAGLPMPKVYIIDAAQPNAFATGRNPSHAAVAVTTGIMNIKHRDILISTIAATIAGAISYLANMAQWGLFFGRHDDEEGGNPIAVLLMAILAPIAALLIQMAISRSREYAADDGGSEIAGNPRYLSNALRKLHWASQKIPLDANPATSHMFIVNPLSGGSIARLFSTHPPIEERIKRLEGRL